MNATQATGGRRLLRIAALGAACLPLLALAATWAWLHAPLPVPAFEGVRAGYQPSEAWLLDRNGELLDVQRVRYDYRRLAWVPLADVSPAFLDALVAGEDHRFRGHAGVDWRAAAAAARDGLLKHRPRGASTLTMQLVRLMAQQRVAGAGRPADYAGWLGKLRQARMALALERRWSKPQVLEAYVNLLGFRGELQGIGAAARQLAGRDPSAVTADEGAVLAALLPSPGAGAEAIATRACARLRQQDPAARCDQLAPLAATLLGRAGAGDGPHLAPQVARALLRAPGERVRSTLDARVQRLASATLAARLADLAGHNVRDGAALVLDNASGEVLAYVGSAGAMSRAAQVDGVQAPRQAGSTLKPFLYGLALERGYLDAASLLEDAPLDVATGAGAYVPQDYEQDYKGLVSARTALAGSLNVPAVRTLLLVGTEAFAQRLRDLGYEGIVRPGDWYGGSLALGSAEVTLWQQARAYRTLALGGHATPLRPLRLDGGDAGAGAGAGAAAPPVMAVMPPAPAFIVGDILADRGARAITFGLGNVLETPFWSAAKTGTSKDMRDNWCIGWSRHYTVAVWVGNFEGDPMREVSGVSGAAPAWRAILVALEAGTGASRGALATRGAPAAPVGVVRVPVRFEPAVEPPRQEWFLAGHARDVVAAVGEEAVPRIESPQAGALLAIDPDMDERHQRVAIRVRGARAGSRLLLDGEPLAEAAELVLWRPEAGVHELVLQDGGGRTLDDVRFQVRASPR